MSYDRIANGFIGKVRAYRNANDRIAELVVRVEAIWLKTETQVTALRNVRGHNHARLQQFHEECLRRLIAKLCAASVEVETFVDAQIEDLNLMQLSVHARPVRKLRYSLLENHLKKTIQSLEDWHAVFDPSWFLLTLHSSKSIDFELEQQPSKTQGQQDISAVIAIRTVLQRNKSDTPTTRSVFRDESFVSPEQEGLPHSNLTIAALQQTGNRVILDTTAYPESVDKGQTTCHVRDLARTLSCSQPSTLGLLQCIGVMKKLDTSGKISQYQFVFLYPSEHYTTTSSLRALLLRGPISLDAKYAIAKSLTRGVLAVHSADFVHKSIRPDNILVFNDSNDQETKAYLVGFEQIRPAAASTSLIGDMLWERNLYRHPSRQGVRPEHIYIMQHDIYSLGVCLLEIGIWNSLVIPSVPPKPGKLLHIEGQLKMNNTLKAAWEIKKTLIHMARTFLPSLMGKVYTNVVLSCLTCLDPDATNMFASEKDLYDEDGILVGVVFIELILSKLGSISV
ncbi:MAG: hypothetical protein Q9195_006435 [Heterodermia aff. obscurata]